MAMKRRVEDDEIERQLKCKICGVGLHSRVLRRVPYKGAIQLDQWFSPGAMMYFGRATGKSRKNGRGACKLLVDHENFTSKVKLLII
jgi:hypothetical protein